MFRWSKIVIVGLTSILLFGCTTNDATVSQSSQPKGPVKIVTTISPLYSFALSVVSGTDARVDNIVPPQSSVHEFQLTPDLVKKIEDADVVIVNGLGLEGFLADVLSTTKARIVDTSEGVELLKNAKSIIVGDQNEHEDEGEFNPHIWMDPNNAVLQIDNIAKALSDVDPKNAINYDRNAVVLKTRIFSFDAETKDALSKINVKPFVVFHDAYPYFEKAYGLQSVASFEPFPGREPSPQYLKAMVDLIKEKGVKVVFAEPQFSPKLVQTFAADYSLKVGELDPEGAELDRDGYLKMMRKNLAALQKAFTD